MSNLQISLAVLGFVVLALIIAYNSWSPSMKRSAIPRAMSPEWTPWAMART
jgi:hypothetical protein